MFYTSYFPSVVNLPHVTPLTPTSHYICLVGKSGSQGLSQCLTVAAITTFVRGQKTGEAGVSDRYICWRGYSRADLSPPLLPHETSRNGTRFISWRQGFCSVDELAPPLGPPPPQLPFASIPLCRRRPTHFSLTRRRKVVDPLLAVTLTSVYMRYILWYLYLTSANPKTRPCATLRCV